MFDIGFPCLLVCDPFRADKILGESREVYTRLESMGLWSLIFVDGW